MKQKRIIVLGAGESGTGAALLAKAKGYDVFVSDFGAIKNNYTEQLLTAEIPFEEKQHTESKILNADLVIKSPGIPYTAPIIVKLQEKGIKVIDELEFAYRFTEGKIIAITGTNGKTTTTLLTYHLLKEAGLNVGLGGNVGKSMAAQLIDKDYEWWVLEVSSFQIDGFKDFKPDVAVLLNITPDHLDRYDKNLANYAHAKFRLFMNMDKSDHIIINGQDSIIEEFKKEEVLNAPEIRVATEQLARADSYVTDEEIVLKYLGKELKFELSLLSIKGKHNQINAMASIFAATLAGLKASTIKDSLPKFKNAQHRMELIASIHGVDFINDSKATNVDAVYYALESFSRPVIWIVGGVDKGNDYSKLNAVSSSVKGVICLGKDNQKIKDFYKDQFAIIEETQSMDEAVRMGYKLAKDREVVLLSPACASFDLFKNYEDRGNQFRMAVQLLEREVALKSMHQA
ncbi:UDP-N-acetylmuramoyl-L-alanine--D-glutamate ligase [Marivirga atlantica]|uniref:UDP-N-acetylmuramoylalanine--D-glutamate ligase n=1 Tax=Marivirga atlantica TaxID=1548457 RepID=A0A937DKZ1_9BACT|nr:UDP-N-acetylmuramoyl-L-alanine--D-glutamate ligase [Marivirga atlantica]MBL0766731.1 UDP-N-acetylmuramoyl-L-alanine--D-glutamate ligase [Marivirga atlantica]